MSGHVLGRTLARLALLALLVGAGDRFFAWGFARVLARSQFRFSLLQRGGQAARVIVLGDSRAVNGFYAPELARLLDAPVLNLGYNGMSTRIGEAVLRDYLARNAPPRLLVLEITNVNEEDYALADLRSYWNGCPELGRLAAGVFPVQHAATRLSHLYSLNGEMPLRALYYLRRSDQDWVNRYRIEPGLIAATRAAPGFSLTAREENLAALGRTVRLARSAGIDVRLVATPYLPDYFVRITNWTTWIACIHRAAGGGERIWDYTGADDNPDHFADRVHLNDLGAPAFAARLVRDGFFGGVSAAGPAEETVAAAR